MKRSPKETAADTVDDISNGEVIVPINRAKILKIVLLLLVCVAMTALMATMAFAPSTATKPVWLVRTVGAIGLVFFGFGLLVWIQLVFSQASGLAIDRDGLVEKTSYLGAGRIRWKDIREMRLLHFGFGQVFIVIDPHDPRQFVERGTLLQRWLKGINRRLFGSPVLLNLVLLDARPEDLLDALKDFHARSKRSRKQPRRIANKPLLYIADKSGESKK